jgi:DNA modification methylase
MSWAILQADARQIPMKDKSVQMVCTSPPYWGLRDYATNGQIGLEKTPEEYVEKIVAVFREVWRVLRDDGTVWLNLGDSYAAQQGNGFNTHEYTGGTNRVQAMQNYCGDIKVKTGLPPKNLVGIPWRIAFALQADGWYLRSDIIWSKPNPMPESVTDRPTKAHEYIFLLSKKERYFFDQDAVREKQEEEVRYAKTFRHGKYVNNQAFNNNGSMGPGEGKYEELEGYYGRNIRTVWEIATQPYPEAHFATFPEEIAERCIKAGTSEKGCCAECGKAWERVTERENQPQAYPDRKYDRNDPHFATKRNMGARYQAQLNENPFITLGWQSACKCDAPSIPCIVLDPFAGAGTTALVADKLNRRGIGLELKSEYCQMAHHRCFDDAPLLRLMENLSEGAYSNL